MPAIIARLTGDEGLVRQHHAHRDAEGLGLGVRRQGGAPSPCPQAFYLASTGARQLKSARIFTLPVEEVDRGSGGALVLDLVAGLAVTAHLQRDAVRAGRPAGDALGALVVAHQPLGVAVPACAHPQKPRSSLQPGKPTDGRGSAQLVGAVGVHAPDEDGVVPGRSACMREGGRAGVQPDGSTRLARRGDAQRSIDAYWSLLVQHSFWYGCRPVSIDIRAGVQIGETQSAAQAPEPA